MNKILIAFVLLLNVCHAQDLMVQTSPLVEEEPQTSPPYQLEGQILNMEISPLGEDVELTERAYDLAMPVYVTPNWDLIYDKKNQSSGYDSEPVQPECSRGSPGTGAL